MIMRAVCYTDITFTFHLVDNTYYVLISNTILEKKYLSMLFEVNCSIVKQNPVTIFLVKSENNIVTH